jgi:hypothetical protein
MPTPEEILSDEFFSAAHSTTSCHEEWLLRICSRLANREREIISFLTNLKKSGVEVPDELLTLPSLENA